MTARKDTLLDDSEISSIDEQIESLHFRQPSFRAFQNVLNLLVEDKDAKVKVAECQPVVNSSTSKK